MVIANLTSFRTFKIDSLSEGRETEGCPTIHELDKRKSAASSSWILEDDINELVRKVEKVVHETDPDSWVLAVPFSLIRQVLPLIDPEVTERLDTVLVEDLIFMSVDQISQMLAAESCDRFGHQNEPSKQFEPTNLKLH